MKVKNWKKQLRKSLRLCGVKDISSAESFYNELIADKLDSGESEEQITAQLGDPRLAAERIAVEEGSNAYVQPSANPQKTTFKLNVGALIGYAFLLLCIVVPLFAAYLGVMAAVMAVALAGAACAFAGVLAAVVLLIAGFAFNSAIKNVVMISCVLCVAGVGLLLFVPFAKLSALMAKGAIGIAKYVVNKVKKEIINE